MTSTSMETHCREPSPGADRITALVVVDDEQYRERIEATIGDDDGLSIRTRPSVTDPLTCLDDIDCLVSEYPAATGDGDDLLERVRERVPDLPVVFLVDDREGTAGIVDTVQNTRWTDYVSQRAATVAAERLGHRIRTLVHHRRLDALSRRSLASIELAQDPIAIVDPDGEFGFANRSYAMQFGYDRDALFGAPWQALFTDDSVERLETTAIPTVADGWRWTGTCTGRRKSGSTFPVRIRLGGLEDGSLVFVVDQSAVGDETGETR
ncbi:PAS domain S-box protein [Natronorubrum halophilum]|uniref:PAS domain S-box protein n=1 Tax=Natronorubrum halophilum TaxID=1702106 RepID=UPI0010C1D85A|nr:PAS domain S-box protein [Natronorubrum halophilum]